jgi:hypothetical protein
MGALFRRSEAYQQALKLYVNRHLIADKAEPAELLKELLARHLEPQSAEPRRRQKHSRSSR